MTTYRSFDRARFIGAARAYRAAVEASVKLGCKFKLELDRFGNEVGYSVRLLTVSGAYIGHLSE